MEHAVTKAVSPVVVRFGRLGDTVLLQPLLHRLHRRFGQPCVLLASGVWPASLYAGHADVARVIQIRHVHWPFALSPERWRAVLALHRLRDAPVYVCEPEPRALSKVRRMLFLAGIHPDNCQFLSDMRMTVDEHWIDRLLRFGDGVPRAFRDFGYNNVANGGSTAPRLQLGETDRADRDAWLCDRELADGPLVLLQPANKRTMRWSGVRGPEDDKWWPVERWTLLARSIRARLPESHVLLCGTPVEADYLHTIRKAAANARVHVMAEALPLRRLMALLEIAHSMVSVDTGPAHLAAALGCPVVVLFGKVSSTHWKPRSVSSNTVCAMGGPSRGGRIDALSAEEVVAAWAALPRRIVDQPR